MVLSFSANVLYSPAGLRWKRFSVILRMQCSFFVLNKDIRVAKKRCENFKLTFLKLVVNFWRWNSLYQQKECAEMWLFERYSARGNVNGKRFSLMLSRQPFQLVYLRAFFVCKTLSLYSPLVHQGICATEYAHMWKFFIRRQCLFF